MIAVHAERHFDFAVFQLGDRLLSQFVKPGTTVLLPEGAIVLDPLTLEPIGHDFGNLPPH
jgi:hypothetical protein